jgi:hypothetical protein
MKMWRRLLLLFGMVRHSKKYSQYMCGSFETLHIYIRTPDLALFFYHWSSQNITFSFWGTGDKASSKPECTAPVCGVIDILQDMYGKTMHRLLHIGPGTCGIVSKLLKESNPEVWGIQPFRMKPPVHETCESFVKKGLIRVAEVNQPLPYRSRSFSFVLVTDTLDIMKKRDLNATLPELSRLSAHNLVVVVGKALKLETRHLVLTLSMIIVVRTPSIGRVLH